MRAFAESDVRGGFYNAYITITRVCYNRICIEYSLTVIVVDMGVRPKANIQRK